MNKFHKRSENIHNFIVDHVEEHPANISKITAQHFDITRQAMSMHLKKLVKEGILAENGNTRNRTYTLLPLLEWDQSYKIIPGLAEDQIWREDIRPLLGDLTDNVDDIWYYAFTEMFNNAIDHSNGSEILVQVKKTAANIEILIYDNGIGIFKKIQQALNLMNESHAVLELSKGKLTTDSKNHTGQGIFFTSRMMDFFCIRSGIVYFSHRAEAPEDWISKTEKSNNGTLIRLKLKNHTTRTSKKIFDSFTGDVEEDYAFNKTLVPITLAQYGNDNLISRSEAKRILARLTLFKIVIFDFNHIHSIGQAFSDEIFRVFAKQHPEIEISFINANPEVKRMIIRAKSEE